MAPLTRDAVSAVYSITAAADDDRYDDEKWHASPGPRPFLNKPILVLLQ